MSQSDFGNLESPLSGTDFFNNKLEPWRDALHSLHKGPSRPSYATAGMMWINDTTTPWVLNIFDGNDDIALGTINATTNIFTPAGGGITWGGTAAGTANALTLTPTYGLTNTAGEAIRCLIGSDNTSQTATLAVSGQSALSIKKNGPTGLVPIAIGDLTTGRAADFLCDGTNWILMNPAANARAADVASASTTDLTTLTGNYVQITGTASISAFTMKRGQIVKVVATGASTLVHSASLLCPSAKNVALQAGDSFTLEADTSSVVRVVDFCRASGAPARHNTEVTVASASTTDIGAALGNIVSISGNTTITAFGSNASADNPLYFLRFTGAPLLTHNATSLILPGGQNIQAAAGDTAIAKYEGSGNWRVIAYIPAIAVPGAALPRKVNDFMRDGRYGRAMTSIFIDCKPEIAPSVGTFGRTSTGWRWNRAGFLESVASGTARHDYDMTTGKYRGILMEPARTNQILRSQEFGNAAWTTSAGSITSDSDVAPDGTTTADSMASATVTYNTTGVGNCTVDNTSSIFAKPKTGTPILTLRQNRTGDGTNYIEAQFNLSTGQVSNLVANGNASGAFAEIQGPDARGYYRCIVGGISSSTAGTVTLNPNMSVGATAAIWGAQCEAGRGATSYIPTTTVGVARSADTWTLALGNTNFNPFEGSLLFVGDYDTTAVSDQSFVALDDGAGANYMNLSANFPTYNLMAANFIASSVFQAQFTHTPPGARGEFAHALGYKVNDFNGTINGAAPNVDTSGSVPTGMTTLRMGALLNATQQAMIGHVRQVAVMNKKLTDAELQEMTQWLKVA